MRDVLNRAADLIEIDGWRQDYESPGHCILEALTAAGAPEKAYGCVMRHLGIEGDHPRCELMIWNDDFLRTEDDVLKALRGAAEKVTP